MAPRGRKRKAGLMREDAARDRMRDMGFEARVISESIKELLKVYGEDEWFLIEDANYDPLLCLCLEKQEEKNKQLANNKNKEMAVDQKEVILTEQMAEEEQANHVAGEEQANQLAEIQNHDMAEDQNELIAEEEQVNHLAGEEESNQMVVNQEEEKESAMHIEDGRDQADTVSIASEAVVDPSPAVLQFGDASVDYAPHSVEGAENTHCGWLIDEEDSDGDGDGDDDDDDDEIIKLTPEPLCEELEELLREVGQKKRKNASRWDTESSHELL